MEHAVFPAQLELLVMQSAAQNGNVGFFFLSMLVCWFKGFLEGLYTQAPFLFSLLALCM